MVWAIPSPLTLPEGHSKGVAIVSMFHAIVMFKYMNIEADK